ncbi:MAG: hypothetical protein B7Z55_08965, partial [Planctomycetales bacterium 12-60-4]
MMEGAMVRKARRQRTWSHWLWIAMASTAAVIGAVWQSREGVAQDVGRPPGRERGGENREPAREAPQKVGVTIKKAGALPGYTLLSPMNSTKTYLIDMDGRVVNTWDCQTRPAMVGYLLE